MTEDFTEQQVENASAAEELLSRLEHALEGAPSISGVIRGCPSRHAVLLGLPDQLVLLGLPERLPPRDDVHSSARVGGA